MQIPIKQHKATLRKSQLEKRQLLDATLRASYSKAICVKLQTTLESLRPTVVHAFWPMPTEVDIRPLLRHLVHSGVTVLLPKVLGNRLMEPLICPPSFAMEDGVFGTKHPENGTPYFGEIDAFIIPGLAFDGKGNRLGYGAGFFDTFLKTQPTGKRIGVAFPFQMVTAVPTAEHDVPMDVVVTP